MIKRIKRMDVSPLWSCSIQLARENWATQPSPYTVDGETYTATYSVGEVSPIDTSFCTRFHLDTSSAASALFSLALCSNNLGILGADSDHTVLPSIREIIYSGEWYVDPAETDNVGSVELDFSLFLDTTYIPGAFHFRRSQLNGENSFPDEWDITNGNNQWQPTGIRGVVREKDWNSFSLHLDVDAAANFRYHSIEMNGDKAILDWSYAPIILPAHAGWWGAQPNVQGDALKRPLDLWTRDLAAEVTN
jgi:hypothetical protein